MSSSSPVELLEENFHDASAPTHWKRKKGVLTPFRSTTPQNTFHGFCKPQNNQPHKIPSPTPIQTQGKAVRIGNFTHLRSCAFCVAFGAESSPSIPSTPSHLLHFLDDPHLPPQILHNFRKRHPGFGIDFLHAVLERQLTLLFTK